MQRLGRRSRKGRLLRRKKTEQTIVYIPGKLEKQLKQNPGARILYRGTERQKIWIELVACGIKHILDLSPPGAGKTHAWGLLGPWMFKAMVETLLEKKRSGEEDFNRLIYVHPQHNNPATITLSLWENLPPRNNGMVEDYNHPNPDGSPRLKWPKGNEVANVPGNCKYAALFAAGNEQNIDPETLKSICLSCEYGPKKDKKTGKIESYDCLRNGGVGHGYKGKRQEALKSMQMRAHAASLPDPSSFEYDKTGIFWDESQQSLPISKKLFVCYQQILQTFAELEVKSPQLSDRLAEVRRAILRLFDIELPRFGLSDSEIREIFAEQINPSLFDYRTDIGSQIISEVSRHLSVDIEKEIKSLGLQNVQQSFKLNWLSDFLKAIADPSYGVLSLSEKGIELNIRDDKAARIARAAGFNIYADATANPDTVCRMVGIDRKDLVVIQEIEPRYTELNVIEVNFNRHICNGPRTATMEYRIAAAREELNRLHGGEIMFFEYKANASPGDLIHFLHNRGVNHAADKKAICAIGDAYPHRGAIATQYQLLFGRSPLLDGTDEDYESYYEECYQAEIQQKIGRLRVFRRQALEPGEFYYYHFGSGKISLDFVESAFPGCKFQKVLAQDITPDAAPNDIKFKVALIEAGISIIQNGDKVTQQRLAEKMDVSQGAISKFAKTIIGGWKFLRDLFHSLLHSLSRESNNLPQALDALSPEEREWLSDYFEPVVESAFEDDYVPQESIFVQAIETVEKYLGRERILPVIRGLKYENQVKILAYLMELAGFDLQEFSPEVMF